MTSFSAGQIERFFWKVEVMRYIIHKYLRFSIITAFINVWWYSTVSNQELTKFELVDPGLLSLVFVVQTFILFQFNPANLVYFAEI
jgi:hypothetical protein